MLFASLTGSLPKHAFSKRFISAMDIKRRLAPKPLKENVLSSIKKFGPRLAWILRHNAPSLGIYMRPDGYVLAEDVLKVGIFKRMKSSNLQNLTTLDTLRRFEWKERQPNEWWVRATGEHSIKFVSTALKEVTGPLKHINAVYVAGPDEWDRIQYEGIRPSEGKNLIELSQSVPDPVKYALSGKASPVFVIYVDLEKAMQNGFGFYSTVSKTIVTDGLVRNENDLHGCISPTFFRKVERLEWSNRVMEPRSLTK